MFAIFSFANDIEDRVKNFVINAGQFAIEVGKKEAIKVFNNPSGKYSSGEFYIFAMAINGTVLAHSKDKILVGKNVIDAKDLDGKYFIKEILKAAKSGDGWVSYYWKNPKNKKIMRKKSYVLRVDDSYAIIGGFYISK